MLSFSLPIPAPAFHARRLRLAGERDQEAGLPEDPVQGAPVLDGRGREGKELRDGPEGVS